MMVMRKFTFHPFCFDVSNMGYICYVCFLYLFMSIGHDSRNSVNYIYSEGGGINGVCLRIMC